MDTTLISSVPLPAIQWLVGVIGACVAFMWGVHRFLLERRAQALMRSDNLELRRRQFEVEDWREIRAENSSLRREIHELTQRLIQAEQDKIELIRRIGELQLELENLRLEVQKLAAKLSEGKNDGNNR